MVALKPMHPFDCLDKGWLNWEAEPEMQLVLIDVGNSRTHIGLGNERGVVRRWDFPTARWSEEDRRIVLAGLSSRLRPDGVAVASVVPSASRQVEQWARARWGRPTYLLSGPTACGVGVKVDQPRLVGADRVANAIALRHRYGAPGVAIDFGTATTFDVVNARGDFVGGAILPGISLMVDSLYRQTARLPRVRVRPMRRAVGRNTQEAIVSGVLHGYRGMVKELVRQIRRELRAPRLRVVATGSYADLIVRGMEEVEAIDPQLTLDGLRRFWLLKQGLG